LSAVVAVARVILRPTEACQACRVIIVLRGSRKRLRHPLHRRVFPVLPLYGAFVVKGKFLHMLHSCRVLRLVGFSGRFLPFLA
jgi:hypothetical protein